MSDVDDIIGGTPDSGKKSKKTAKKKAKHTTAKKEAGTGTEPVASKKPKRATKKKGKRGRRKSLSGAHCYQLLGNPEQEYLKKELFAQFSALVKELVKLGLVKVKATREGLTISGKK